MPDDNLSPWELREIKNDLKELKLQGADLTRAVNGTETQIGLRQQLRELKHYVEGNPPAVRGLIYEIKELNSTYQEMHLSLTNRYDQLRKDFDDYVKRKDGEELKRAGTWGGAKLVWGALGTALLGLIAVLGLLVSIYSATVGGT